MKKYILILMLAITVVSCKDFLNEQPYGLILPSTFPTTTDDLEKCVNALFSNGNAMYNQSSCYTTCMGGDDITTQAGGNKPNYLQFDVFNGKDNNPGLLTRWNSSYQTIKSANLIILSIDKITYGYSLTSAQLQAQKNLALGEAYFYRALAYFNLVRDFGQVPIITNLNINYNAPKGSFSEIYAFIVNDLTKAQTLVPVDYRTVDGVSALTKQTYYARPTIGTVNALLSSVYLTMAGYPLKDASNYALAAQTAKAVIDNAVTYGYKLLPNYADLWKWQNGWQSTGNAEDVFACYFNRAEGNWSDAGTSSNGNMNAPDAFLPQDFGGWSDAFAELTYFNEFPAGPRKDATFLTHGQVSSTSPDITWQNFLYKHPHFKKYMDISPGVDTLNLGNYIDWWSDRTVQVIRYAEVLLVYAEAKAMSDGPDALAYQCLNAVRTRAGLAPYVVGSLSATNFATKVIEERKWEFGGVEPCARWYDMIRTETVESATLKRDPAEVPLVNQPTHANYFAPIPSVDSQLNSNL